MECVKRCNGLCQLELPLEKFHKGNGSFNVKSRCIDCCKHYKPKTKEHCRQYYSDNVTQLRQYKSEYYLKNLDREKAIRRQYDVRNRAAKTAREAKRRAAELQATPRWLTEHHFKQILTKYQLSDSLTQNTGIRHHVDHIVPLQGKIAKGLHVPWNLQVIPWVDNLKKGNKV